MTYVMSDIHGLYDKYIKLLDKINFKQKDELYILGDAVDFGERGVDVLFDMSVRSNVFPLLGEHEYMLLCYLKGKMNDSDFEKWQMSGGDVTLKALREKSADDHDALCEYLEDMPLYEEIEIGNERYVLTHSGFSNFVPEKPLEDYALSDLLNARIDYTRRYFDDTFLVSGHIPTFRINKGLRGKVYVANGHIGIDCGAVYGGSLSALRLDDGEAFYV